MKYVSRSKDSKRKTRKGERKKNFKTNSTMKREKKVNE